MLLQGVWGTSARKGICRQTPQPKKAAPYYKEFGGQAPVRAFEDKLRRLKTGNPARSGEGTCEAREVRSTVSSVITRSLWGPLP